MELLARATERAGHLVDAVNAFLLHIQSWPVDC